MADQVSYATYEVFVQRDHKSQHEHVGSILAGSPEDAIIMARENFLRRDPAVSVWVVRREDIHATAYEDRDFFARETDRSYRVLAGYKSNNDKWRKYRKNMLTLQELVKE